MWAAYKLLSNFKGFYNEINSATLTGAIDVIIVQQEDGTFVSSPFHVRFGKTGVLRSKEKVVDISINGEPVDLHMKLGDAGEAFFVQQADDFSQLPAHLATSPIDLDAASLMEMGIKRLKIEAEQSSSEGDQPIKKQVIQGHVNKEEVEENSQSNDRTHPNVKQSGSQTEGLYDTMLHSVELDKKDCIKPIVEVKREDSSDSAERNDSETPTVGFNRDESQASLYYSTADLDSPMRDAPPGGLAPNKTKVDVCIQTDMSGPEIESKAKITDRERTVSEVSSNTSSKHDNSSVKSSDKTELPSVNNVSPSKLRNNSVCSNVSKPESQTSLSSTPVRTENSSHVIVKPKAVLGTLAHRDSEASLHSLHSQASAETYTAKATENTNKRVQKRRRQRKKRHSESSSNESLSIPEGGMFDIDIEVDEVDNNAAILNSITGMGRSVSMPFTDENVTSQNVLPVDKHRLTAEWAKNQFASQSHPWSDADITPIMSPISSRPPSPKSDTEYETQKFDCSSQTSITGLGQEINKLEDILWEWGELPTQATPSRQPQQETDKTHDGASKPPGGLLQFMRKTKKIRHQPEQEGIYLDDLNLDEMDPEVAALYLYGKKSPRPDVNSLKNTLCVAIDEDNESGRGASLPQSPVSMDSQVTTGTSLFRPLTHKPGNVLPDIALSLCGGLKDKDNSQSMFGEKFSQNLVTYDDFCTNPSMLTDPNLVIKIENKYYNYQMAGPMFMSYLAFNRPLPEPVVDSLVKQHMPKKESRRRSWFPWGRGTDETIHENESKEKANETQTPTSIPQSSVPNSPRKKMKRVDKHHDDSSEDEEGGETMEIINEDLDEMMTSKIMVKSQSMSGIDEFMKVYEKSLKLSSEEIAKLNLQYGKNVAQFSVTTQYQGTAKCQANIFLWKWDTKIIISDVDGTITKSDVLGHVLPLVGKDWSQAGITTLFNEIDRNGYQFVYLSARAIGQAGMTRDYLRSVTQENNMKLPEGPLLLSPNSLVRAFHQEVIEKKPEEFKIGCLRNIKALFPTEGNPFYAGFGNKINDAFAYRTVGIPMSRIFTVNPRGELRMELISNFLTSYTKLRDIVDMFFPPLLDIAAMKLGSVHPRVFPAADEYSSFTYWRETLPDVTLEMEEIMSNDNKESQKSK